MENEGITTTVAYRCEFEGYDSSYNLERLCSIQNVVDNHSKFQTLLEVECDAGGVPDGDCDRNKEKGGVEDSSEENTAVDDFLVISKPISQETNQGRGEEHTEGENAVDEGHI